MLTKEERDHLRSQLVAIGGVLKSYDAMSLLDDLDAKDLELTLAREEAATFFTDSLNAEHERDEARAAMEAANRVLAEACEQNAKLRAVAEAAESFCKTYRVKFEAKGGLIATGNYATLVNCDLTGKLREALRAAGFMQSEVAANAGSAKQTERKETP